MKMLYLVLILVLSINSVIAQNTQTTHDIIRQVLSDLQSNQWQGHDRALVKIRGILEKISEDASNLKDVSDALLNELKKESEYDFSNEEGEGHGEYLIELSDLTIILMRNDPRIIEPLLNVVDTIGGNPLEEALVDFGDITFDAITENYKKINSDMARQVYLRIAIEILEKNKLSLIKKPIAKTFALEILNDESFKLQKFDESFMNRKYAIEILEALNFSSTIPIIEIFSQVDPFVNTKGIYVVRERAKAAVEKMKASQK